MKAEFLKIKDTPLDNSFMDATLMGIKDSYDKVVLEIKKQCLGRMPNAEDEMRFKFNPVCALPLKYEVVFDENRIGHISQRQNELEDFKSNNFQVIIEFTPLNK